MGAEVWPTSRRGGDGGHPEFQTDRHPHYLGGERPPAPGRWDASCGGLGVGHESVRSFCNLWSMSPVFLRRGSRLSGIDPCLLGPRIWGRALGNAISHLYSRWVGLHMWCGDHDVRLLGCPPALSGQAAGGAFHWCRTKIWIFVRDGCGARIAAALARRLVTYNCQSYAWMPQNMKHCARGGCRAVQRPPQKTTGLEWGAGLCC